MVDKKALIVTLSFSLFISMPSWVSESLTYDVKSKCKFIEEKINNKKKTQKQQKNQKTKKRIYAPMVQNLSDLLLELCSKKINGEFDFCIFSGSPLSSNILS